MLMSAKLARQEERFILLPTPMKMAVLTCSCDFFLMTDDIYKED